MYVSFVNTHGNHEQTRSLYLVQNVNDISFRKKKKEIKND